MKTIPIVEFKQDYKKSWEHAISLICDYQKSLDIYHEICTSYAKEIESLKDDVEHWKEKYKELENDIAENYTRKHQNPYEYGE